MTGNEQCGGQTTKGQHSIPCVGVVEGSQLVVSLVSS